MREVIGQQRNGEHAQTVADVTEGLAHKVSPKGARGENARPPRPRALIG